MYQTRLCERPPASSALNRLRNASWLSAELGYECCTWENDGDATITDPRHAPLLAAFNARQAATLRRSRAAAAEEHERLLAAARAALATTPPAAEPPLEQPAYVTAARLEPHQLAGAAFLRRMYVQPHDAIIADDPALGIAATVLTYLQV